MVDTLKGLASITVDVNSSHMGEWPQRIGQYMLNFSSIELLTFQYLTRLEIDRSDFNKNIGQQFGVRVDRILLLVRSDPDMTPALRDEIVELWEMARELATWRNRIAHNAVVLNWKPGSDTNTQPPDELGVIEMKDLRVGDNSSNLPIELMRKLIDATCDVGTRLNDAALRIRPLPMS